MLKQMTDVLSAPRHERVIHHCHDVETLKLLVGKYRCEINVQDGAGYWPLKSFAESGDATAIEYLLKTGADPNFISTGDIALHAAVQHGNPPCVRLLLEHGSDPNQQDVDGWTPLHGVKDMQTLDLLLRAGANPCIGDQVGWRPSHWIKDPEIKARLVAAEREWEKR